MTQKKKCEMGNASHETLASLRRVRRPDTHRRTRRKRRDSKVLKEPSTSGDGGGENEKAEVDRKIKALQRIVPGGELLGVEKLFEETAGYIQALQGQLQAMRLVFGLFQGLDKERRKLGG